MRSTATGRISGPICVRTVGRVADAEPPEEVGDALVVLVEHGRMNEVPRGQCATLTGVEREALHTQLRSLVEIGIGTDDHRRLAAELEDDPLQGRCRLGRDGGADGVGPREGHQVDFGSRRQLVTDRRVPGRRC